MEEINGVFYRYVDLNQDTVSSVAKYLTQRGVAKAQKYFGPTKNVLVNIVACDGFAMGDPENPEMGSGLYLENLRIINIASLKPDQATQKEYETELEKTAIHEYIHFYQDISGLMDFTSEEDFIANEDRTDKLTETIFNTSVGAI